MTNTLERLSPWLFTIGLFAIWEAACRIFRIDPFILPAPSAAFAAIAQYWQPLARHSFVTLWTTMVGFALAVAFGVILLTLVGLGSGLPWRASLSPSLSASCSA